MLSGNLLISSLQKGAVKLMLQEKYTYPEALIVYKIKKKHVSNKVFFEGAPPVNG